MTTLSGGYLTIVLAQANKEAMDHAVEFITESLNVQKLTTLSPNKAVDVKIDAHIVNTLQSDLNAAMREMGIKADICVSSDTSRKKTLLICDMDSTLIGQECIDELADFAGMKEHVSEITERAMRGEIEFDDALKERVSLLKGLNLSVLEQCFNERIKLNTGAKTLCQTMKAHGAKTVIVSGGFTFFTNKVASLCGFDTHQANTLLSKDELLTGEVGMPILGREAKKQALLHFSHNTPEAAIAIGDGANDLAMITASGLGVAYYAKPKVATASDCAINHTDLTTALYFQGYQEREFIK